MRENNLLDFNMYESTLSQNLRQPDGAYAERPCSGGGATYAFSSIPVFNKSGSSLTSVARCYNPIDDNGTFNVTFDDNNGATAFGYNAVLSQPAKKVNLTVMVPKGILTFTPAADFDGIYKNNDKVSLTGDEIVPGDGRTYVLDYDGMSNTYAITANDKRIKSE